MTSPVAAPIFYACDLEWSAQTNPDIEVQLARSVEVSLPCPGCRRDHRTLILSEHEQVRHWDGADHAFEGRVVRKSLSQNQGHILARYHLEYEYEPFVDQRWSPEPVHYQPTWSRLSFRLQCPCGQRIENDTQDNLTRPRSEVCACGRLLLFEMDGALRFGPAAVVMFRPVTPEQRRGLEELSFQTWPECPPGLIFFEPLTHAEFARKVLDQYQETEAGEGILTRFLVKPAFAEQFPVHVVGGPRQAEWRIPAERLSELNANLVGAIEVEP